MIDAAGVERAEQLAALHARAFDKPWSSGEIVKLLQNPAAFALIARGEGAFQGFVLAWAAAGEAELLTVAVVPEARRRGHGAALVTAAGVSAQTRGAMSMHLEVAEDNHAARALYAQLGYIETGRRHAYYAREGSSVDAIAMRCLLLQPTA